MKRLFRRAAFLLGGAGSLAGAVGCFEYRDLVDPCYPQRYEFAARNEVHEVIAPQVLNGHVLDQSVCDDHFEAGTDKLTAGGLEHLKYLARRRPQADPVVFLQAAQDVAYDPAHPDAYAKARAELTNKRLVAVQTFLGAYTDGAPVGFRVVIHDAPVPGQSAVGVARSVLLKNASYQGALPTGGGGGGATGGAGAVPH